MTKVRYTCRWYSPSVIYVVLGVIGKRGINLGKTPVGRIRGWEQTVAVVIWIGGLVVKVMHFPLTTGEEMCPSPKLRKANI